jgi:hypothetical protein
MFSLSFRDVELILAEWHDRLVREHPALVHQVRRQFRGQTLPASASAW